MSILSGMPIRYILQTKRGGHYQKKEFLRQKKLLLSCRRKTCKHSTTCPISARAFKQYQLFLENIADEEIAGFVVKVRETRDVSNQIEAVTGVKHESPQIILLMDKEVFWHTAENINNAVHNLTDTSSQ